MLHKTEFEKPIYIKKKGVIKLKDLMRKPHLRVKLSGLRQKDLKKLVLKRYKMEKKDKKIAILGKGVFTIEKLINEIEKETDVGKMAIKAETRWINFLLKKVEKDEIKVEDMK